jgi:hypothetical protein
MFGGCPGPKGIGDVIMPSLNFQDSSIDLRSLQCAIPGYRFPTLVNFIRAVLLFHDELDDGVLFERGGK